MISHKTPLFPFVPPSLLGHVLEGVSQGLLAEGKLADGPDLGVLHKRY
jgi:hypothetical protein